MNNLLSGVAFYFASAAPWPIPHWRVYRLHTHWRLAEHRVNVYFSRSTLLHIQLCNIVTTIIFSVKNVGFRYTDFENTKLHHEVCMRVTRSILVLLLIGITLLYIRLSPAPRIQFMISWIASVVMIARIAISPASRSLFRSTTFPQTIREQSKWYSVSCPPAVNARECW